MARNWQIAEKRDRYGKIILFNFLKFEVESEKELNQVGILPDKLQELQRGVTEVMQVILIIL